MASLLEKRSVDSVLELTNAVDDAVRAGASVQVVAGTFAGELPPEAARLLADALRYLSDGRAVAVAPYELVIGTEQAAEMLGVSRPWIATMLDRGDLPMRRNGSKRRVLLGDLVAFRRAEELRRAPARDSDSTAALAAPSVMGTAREAGRTVDESFTIERTADGLERFHRTGRGRCRTAVPPLLE